MAPSRVAASQWARRTFAPRSCRVSRFVPSSRQQSTSVPWKRESHEPQLTSLLPTNQARRGSQSKTANAASANLDLSFSDLASDALFLPSCPSLKDASVRTPPPWKSPYIVDSISPKAALELPGPVFSMESTCGSPTKTPGRVAKVFGELLPISPRKKSERATRKIKRQGSRVVGAGLRVMCRLSTVIGLRAPKSQRKSLVELRRQLLQKHRSLHKAFREMENHIKECKNKDGTAWKKANKAQGLHTSMELAEFTKAIAFCGVNSHEAMHFFQLMDTNGDGLITLEEFKSALVRMPRDVLLQDFRKRLLTKYSSTHEAFRELSIAPGHRDKFPEGDQTKPLDREAFAFHLSRLGVEEQESSLLFDIVDTDASGSISLEELRETLREVAPYVSLEEFWHRFNFRWPDIRATASHGPDGRKRATELLFKILPAKYHGSSLDFNLKSHLPLGLTADAWDTLCAQLDVSRTNAEELFRQCATAKMWQGQRTSPPRYPEENQAECDLDDFFDELQLWSQTPLNRQGPGMRQSYGRDMAQRLGFMKSQALAAAEGVTGTP